ncbi:hypothetical protein E0W68_03810 [Flavobacterium salilacus subsp. salilacus]|uniref:hypothetical protein n=1 Tax=Flavobacterium TaxID=237 RepID=UPI0010752A15|nr:MULTISPECIES: hypothetical protein [Flavobacterium]KAF2519483.1 hypothetical protein E0W68_03810 [Flavobacterium salilacus subsp. salilacus]MBE1614620.1 hypothetical protein [Flavobacterium sp. SaA2.13]
MKNYFILLELPGGKELKFTIGNKSPKNFWRNAIRAIRKGRANLICRRQDTGISEALRSYMTGANRFTTFMLTNLKMNSHESRDKKAILNKTVQSISDMERETVIDTNKNFQLVTCDDKP